MAEKNLVEFFEEWQSGAFFIIGPAIMGAIMGAKVGSITGTLYLGVGAFFASGILTFLVMSYIQYGR